MSYTEGGYYNKFEVFKNGERVQERCFTLQPDNDPHALHAILTYADSVEDENPELAKDLRDAFGTITV